MIRYVLVAIGTYGANSGAAAQNVIRIQAGTTLGTGPGAVISLFDTDFNNDGTLYAPAGSGRIVFAGTSDNEITGASVTDFNDLEIAKSEGQSVLLKQKINIRNSIRFNGGLLRLGGQVITLLGNATLQEESESSRITGDQGYVQISTKLNAPQAANPGNLGATVTSAVDLGLTTIRRGHGPLKVRDEASISRYYDINPTNNAALNATLRFHYWDSELNGNKEDELGLWKSSGGDDWVAQIGSVKNSGLNWLELAGIGSFSRWTASDAATSLPVRFSGFAAACYSNTVRLTWETVLEINAARFEILRSPNGDQWDRIGQITVRGTETGNGRYSFSDPESGNAYYRIKAVDHDGSTGFTGIVKAACATAARLWKAGPNPVKDKLSVWMGPAGRGKVSLQLHDRQGRLVKATPVGDLADKHVTTLDMKDIPAGVYLLTVIFADRAAPEETMTIVKE
ncbi:hypothetical protein [Ravibacter arvi]